MYCQRKELNEAGILCDFNDKIMNSRYDQREVVPTQTNADKQGWSAPGLRQ